MNLNVLPYTRQALCGANLMIPTLTEELLPLKINDIIYFAMENRFFGQGLLPPPKDNVRRENLGEVFKAHFSDTHSDDAESVLMDCLPT
ncbi:hypothetical protein NPIL_461661 [Nephila pilipes]|uniref:Uncharacterized protein n=1 Tax=Nephila pilipes TaxID=299642 RepID=A0A8X6TY30_NEPPI|nr:hypothetical protein NPIL_88351 [Nephila pilipes]GFT70888.1 hypothetical protein NPIL_461661 [Nephila pilipes]